MDLGEHLQEGLQDIHLVPQDKVLELHKASPLEVHLAPWLGSHQLGTLDVEVGGILLVQVQQDMQDCSQEGRRGLVGPMEGEDLIYINANIHTLFFRTPIL